MNDRTEEAASPDTSFGPASGAGVALPSSDSKPEKPKKRMGRPPGSKSSYTVTDKVRAANSKRSRYGTARFNADESAAIAALKKRVASEGFPLIVEFVLGTLRNGSKSAKMWACDYVGDRFGLPKTQESLVTSYSESAFVEIERPNHPKPAPPVVDVPVEVRH